MKCICYVTVHHVPPNVTQHMTSLCVLDPNKKKSGFQQPLNKTPPETVFWHCH